MSNRNNQHHICPLMSHNKISIKAETPLFVSINPVFIKNRIIKSSNWEQQKNGYIKKQQASFFRISLLFALPLLLVVLSYDSHAQSRQSQQFTDDVSNLILGDLAASKGYAEGTAKYFEALTRTYPTERLLLQCFNGALQSENRKIAETCYQRLEKLSALQQKTQASQAKKRSEKSSALKKKKDFSLRDEIAAMTESAAVPIFNAKSPFANQTSRVIDELEKRNEYMLVLKARMIALTYPESIAPAKFIAIIQTLEVAKQRALIAQTAKFLSDLRLYSRGAKLLAGITQVYHYASFKVFYANFLRQTWQDKQALAVAKAAYRQEASSLTLFEYIEALQQNGDIDDALNLLEEYQKYPKFMDRVLRVRLNKLRNLRPEPELRALLQKVENDGILPRLQSSTIVTVLFNWFDLKDFKHTLALANKMETVLFPREDRQSSAMLIYLKGASMIALGDDSGQKLIDKVSKAPRFKTMERRRRWRQKVSDEGIDAMLNTLYNMENIIRAPTDYLISAQVLTEYHKEADSINILQHGLKFHPNDAGLLYESAMLAIKLEKPILMERYLSKAILINPKDFHAHNALGYSWSDMNINLSKAKEHINVALTYRPLASVILDSLGWYYYRSGNLTKSLEHLRRAYYLQHDPEIAAHLIEVLWKRAKSSNSKQGKALKNEALLLHQNTILLVNSRADKERTRLGIKLLEEVVERLSIPVR